MCVRGALISSLRAEIEIFPCGKGTLGCSGAVKLRAVSCPPTVQLVVAAVLVETLNQVCCSMWKMVDGLQYVSEQSLVTPFLTS